jgi:hypothetical protein
MVLRGNLMAVNYISVDAGPGDAVPLKKRPFSK